MAVPDSHAPTMAVAEAAWTVDKARAVLKLPPIASDGLPVFAIVQAAFFEVTSRP
jgi:hypothetical protein